MYTKCTPRDNVTCSVTGITSLQCEAQPRHEIQSCVCSESSAVRLFSMTVEQMVHTKKIHVNQEKYVLLTTVSDRARPVASYVRQNGHAAIYIFRLILV